MPNARMAELHWLMQKTRRLLRSSSRMARLGNSDGWVMRRCDTRDSRRTDGASQLSPRVGARIWGAPFGAALVDGQIRACNIARSRSLDCFGLLLLISHFFPSYLGWRFVYSNGAAKVRWWMIMVAALAVWASRGSETPSVVLPSEIADNS
jgi:hypothetical protein